jgi:hypothetical protein
MIVLAAKDEWLTNEITKHAKAAYFIIPKYMEEFDSEGINLNEYTRFAVVTNM